MKIKNKLSFTPCMWICFIAILLVGNSCTKQQDETIQSDYHITFKLDGTPQTFDQGDTCQITQDNSTTPATQVLSIRGHSSAYTMQHAAIIEFALVGSNPVSTGTYVDSSANDAYSVFADYIPVPDETSAPGSNLYMAGDGVYTDGIQKGVQLTHHLTITITSMSNGTIKGTFSGDFYEYDSDIRQAKITSITNGDFYLKVQ